MMIRKSLLCLLALLAGQSVAQSALGNQISTILDFKAIAGTHAGRDLLLTIQAQRPQPTAENVRAIRMLLGGRLTAEERAIAIRIMGGMLDRSILTADQLAMQSDIGKYFESPDRETARAAVFAWSRAGYLPNVEHILAAARDSGRLSTDEYDGELAHNFRFAPPDRQLAISRALQQSRSPLAIDILTMQFMDRQWIVRLEGRVKIAMRECLSASEPNFPFAIGEFGLIDGIRYTNWLHALGLRTWNRELHGLCLPSIGLRKNRSPEIDQLFGLRGRWRLEAKAARSVLAVGAIRSKQDICRRFPWKPAN
jgi:hypothetical protein